MSIETEDNNPLHLEAAEVEVEIDSRKVNVGTVAGLIAVRGESPDALEDFFYQFCGDVPFGD